jgi:thiol-disulfide isomerase/thioredoxin
MSKVPVFILLGALLLAAGAALWLAADEPPTRSARTQTAADGIHYPAILAASFPDIEGRRQPLGQWEGKLLFINFWATWCAPCKEEMPLFDTIFRENAMKGVQIVGIAADPVEKVRLFQTQTPVTYPLLPDAEAALDFSRRMGNRLGMLPHTLVFSPKGELLLNKVGQLSQTEMELIIREHAPK